MDNLYIETFEIKDVKVCSSDSLRTLLRGLQRLSVYLLA